MKISTWRAPGCEKASFPWSVTDRREADVHKVGGGVLKSLFLMVRDWQHEGKQMLIRLEMEGKQMVGLLSSKSSHF